MPDLTPCNIWHLEPSLTPCLSSFFAAVTPEKIRPGLAPLSTEHTRVEVNMILESKGFNFTEHKSFGLPVFAMLFERSPYTNHIYQPKVNYRKTNHAHYEAGRNASNKLMRGLSDVVIGATDTEDIHSHPIMFTPYKVVPDSDESFGCMLTTLGTVIFKNDLVTKFCPCELTKAVGVGVGQEEIAQLLSVFGRAYDHDSTPEGNLAAFADLFADVQLNTVENVNQFLQDFGFAERGVVYETEHPLHFNLLQLGAYIRSLTNFRLAIVDGQHRCNLISLYLIGIFDHSCNSVLDNTHLRGSFFGETDKWETMTVFKHRFNFVFGRPLEHSNGSRDLSDGFDVFHKYGHSKNTAAEHSVQSVDLKVVFDDAVTILESAETFEWSDYILSPGSWKTLHIKCKPTADLVMGQWTKVDGISFLVDNAGEIGSTGVAKLSDTLRVFFGKMMVFVRGRVLFGKTINRYPLCLLSLCVGNLECTSAMRSCFSLPESTHPQRGTPFTESFVQSRHYTANHLGLNLSEICHAAEDCISVDLAALTAFHLCKRRGNAAVMDGLTDADGWTLKTFDLIDKKISNHIRDESIIQITNGVMNKNGSGKTSDVRAVILRIITQALFIDLAGTIQDYGHDPELETTQALESGKHLNQELDFYLDPKSRVAHVAPVEKMETPRLSMDLCLFLWRLSLMTRLSPL